MKFLKKNKQIFLLPLMLLLVLAACKPSPDKARAYYESILDQHQAVLEKEDMLNLLINREMKKALKDSVGANMSTGEVQQENPADLDVAYADFCLQVKESISKTKETGPFHTNHKLLDASMALHETYLKLSEKEYKEVIDIVKIPPSLYTTENDERFFDLTLHIDTCLQTEIDNFTRACKEFALEYNFTIIPSQE